MKKLTKISLNNLEKKELDYKEQSNIKGGGGPCACGCCYAGTGGSSAFMNGQTNCSQGLNSPAFCEGGSYHVC